MKKRRKFSKRWYRQVYLRSPHWQALRVAKLKVTPQCEDCGTKRCLDVHHVSYGVSLYEVTLDMLCTRCRRCHQDRHNRRTDAQAAFELRNQNDFRARWQEIKMLRRRHYHGKICARY